MTTDDILKRRDAEVYLLRAEIERLRAASATEFDRGAEGMRQAILQLLPGGQTCDPQWVADTIRKIAIQVADEQTEASK